MAYRICYPAIGKITNKRSTHLLARLAAAAILGFCLLLLRHRLPMWLQGMLLTEESPALQALAKSWHSDYTLRQSLVHCLQEALLEAGYAP